MRSPRTGPPPTAESWATKARVKLTYPGTEFTADKTVDVWWYDGGELPPDSVREPVGARFPEQGSIVVGTDGMIVLPHVTAEPFVLPDSKMASLPTIELTDRDHYGEFIDVVLGGGKQKCSANFDYAGPLTESVIIGNVAARFSGETLTFDAKALRFPDKPEATNTCRGRIGTTGNLRAEPRHLLGGHVSGRDAAHTLVSTGNVSDLLRWLGRGERDRMRVPRIRC